ncbi:class I adenylate-forming enzyme family protein [Geodermatophilus sabuli]|nr:class I adenylate-forming enzyme family protein [Geodermatophilus sabuli]
MGVVDGHPCRLYADRPHSVAEFLHTARRWADRELLVQGTRRLTSAEHEQAVARVAAVLRDHGVGPGDRVALIGFNSIEWIVSFWAVQAVGGTAVLGNAWWSDDEVTAALDQADPVLVITDRDQRRPALSMASLRSVVDRVEDHLPLVLAPPDEDALSIIMFSSGTTGAPKGVLISHRAVVANIHNLLVLTGRLPDELPDTHPGTVSLLSVPLFHLAGIQVSCNTLLSGGRLVFLEGRFDPAEVLRLIEIERVRVWGSIPTMVSRVLDHPDFAVRDVSSVSSVPMGGSAVSPELRERVATAFAGVKSRVGSLYGLTEAGGVLAAGSGKDVAARPGCVGRALPVVELRIANPDHEGIGEIQARTPTSTGGYLGEDGAIADTDGWISSGDLGRIDADGWLYVTGRSKDVIIRGGENVGAVHVEDRLLTHPDVLEAAVVALPHPDLGEEVAAAVVLRPNAAVQIADLEAHARQGLARYEVPTAWWVRATSLPLNATGKVLRREVRRTWLENGGTTQDERAGRSTA